MPRSVKVCQKFIEQLKNVPQRRGYPRQKDLADELGLSLATVSNFLNGKPVDCENFQEICKKLDINWLEFADCDSKGSNSTTVVENDQPSKVNIDSPPDESEVEDFIYVERPPAEDICYKTLCKPGGLLRIKASGLMGKTSLINKVFLKLAHQGYRTVGLNLHYAEEDIHFINLDKFLRWFCVSVGERLGMPNRLADYWDDEYSTSKTNCNIYFEQYLLKQSNSPLILCLDEVERVFPHPVAAEFLGLLRAWHEDAKFRDVWKKCRLVIVHSTEVYIPLNVNESPFNVGNPIELQQFTPEQVNNLAHQYGLTWDLVQVKQLMDMVGGHPYLLGQAFSKLRMYTNLTLEEILENAPTEAGIYSNHLRHYRVTIQQHQELAEALKKVVMASGTVQLEHTYGYKLHRLGLVQQVGNEVKITCNLYRQYFGYYFGASS